MLIPWSFPIADHGPVVTARVAEAARTRAVEPFTEIPEPSVVTIPILHAVGLFTVQRTFEAILYPKEFAETDLSIIGRRYGDAFTKPPLFYADARPFEWDGDKWYLNVVGHGLMGSELHLRARTCHFGPWAALGFTTLASTVWEYVIEANGVRPSAQDLVYTPLAGLVLGEARYWTWRSADGIGSRTWRSVVRAVVDPFGELERGLGTGC